MARIRNKRGDITTDEIKRILKEYCDQLYTNKLHKLDEMEIFLEKHATENDSRRNNLNKIYNSRTWMNNKNTTHRKSPDEMASTQNYKHLERNQYQLFQNFPKNIREDNTSDNKTKEITRKLQTNNISYEHQCKNAQQNTSKPNPATCKLNYTSQPIRISPRNAKLVPHMRISAITES